MNDLRFIAWSKSTRINYQRHRARINEYANTLNTGDGCANQSTMNYVAYTNDLGDYVNRKLTVNECEILQGYPHNYTKYGRDATGKIYEMSNTQRFQQCGNGISSPVSAHVLESLLPEGNFNMFSLFSGVGGTELRLSDRFKVVAHCEWDKFASDVLRYHHPDIPNFGDVTKVLEKPEQVPQHDILLFGHPCFATGTLVTTSEGLKPIETIKIGDMVLTHTNTFQKVVTPMTKISDHYNKLKIQGTNELVATDEHPFYVRELIGRRYVSSRSSRRTSERVFSEPKWVCAKDLTKNHFVGIAFNQNSTVLKSGNLPTNSPDFWWLIGKILADGWTSSNNRTGKENKIRQRVVIACNKNNNEVEVVSNILKKLNLNFCKCNDRTTYKLALENKELKEFVNLFGKYSYGKRLPGFVFDLPESLLKSLIDGYLFGDGYFVKGINDRFGITSVNLELLTGFQQIIQKVYKTQSSITKSKVPSTKVPSTKVIEGRVVNQRCFYALKFHKEHKANKLYYYDGSHIWTPFKSRERFEISIPVYNLEVEKDNSYCVHNLIAHNCQSFSEAGLRQGLASDKGKVIYDIFKIIEHYKPKYIFQENVKGLLTHDGGTTFTEICKAFSSLGYEFDFNLFNSSNFGLPQIRNRMFLFGRRKDEH